MLVSDWHCSSCPVFLSWAGFFWCWYSQWLAGLMLWVMLLAMWLLLLVIWTWFFMWKLLLILCSDTGGMSESIFYSPGHEDRAKEEVILSPPFRHSYLRPFTPLLSIWLATPLVYGVILKTTNYIGLPFLLHHDSIHASHGHPHDAVHNVPDRNLSVAYGSYHSQECTHGFISNSLSWLYIYL